MPNMVRFAGYEVDLSAGRLYKHGVKINLREKSFQVLVSLLEHPEEVVTREDLRRQLWREEVFVDFDNNLNTAIVRLREALCDSADHPRFIETLPKRGYRFLKSVSELPLTPEKRTAKRARLIALPFVNLSSDPAEEYFSEAMILQCGWCKKKLFLYRWCEKIFAGEQNFCPRKTFEWNNRNLVHSSAV